MRRAGAEAPAYIFYQYCTVECRVLARECAAGTRLDDCHWPGGRSAPPRGLKERSNHESRAAPAGSTLLPISAAGEREGGKKAAIR